VGLGTEALLEVLDPEQNSSFRAHYLDASCSVSSGFHQISLNTG
jgi:ATP-dependent Lon protease